MAENTPETPVVKKVRRKPGRSAGVTNATNLSPERKKAREEGIRLRKLEEEEKKRKQREKDKSKRLSEKERAQSAADKLYKAMLEQPLVFGMMFLEHHFRDQSPQFHLKILEESMKNPFFAVAAPRGSAKAQSLDSSVLTKCGWKKFSDLKVGDKIIGGDGRETAITHLHPIAMMDLYKVKFRHGGEVVCNLDHLWEVYCPSNHKSKRLVYPLKKIMENYIGQRNDPRYGTHTLESRYYVKTAPPIQFPEKEFHVDPYTLGVWLGDGHSAGSRITTPDPEIFSYMPYEWKKNNTKFLYTVKRLSVRLRKYGLLNNKHIPNEYLFGSIAQREALLQGLLDSDGHVPKKKSAIVFTNKKRRIIDGICHLVGSLGGKYRVDHNVTSCNGKWFHSWRVQIWLPDSIKPCKLKRKLKEYRGGFRDKLYIQDISFYKRDLGRCITVDNADGMYITDGFVRTHNSTVLAFLKALHAITFKRRRFVVIVMNTFKKAAQALESIKAEIKENHELKSAFHMKLVKDAEGDAVITHRCGFKTRILCKGAEQLGSVRGEKFGAYRPDYIIVDDLEDDELVKNPDRRKELKQQFNDALIEARDVTNFDVDVIGTILHDDSLMAELVSKEHYPEYRKLLYRARYETNDGYSSLWPERWTVEQLNKMEQDKPATFAKEMQNDPVSGLQSKFRREDFRYWRMEQDKYYLMDQHGRVVSSGDMSSCKAAIACDLAWETKRENDFSVIMPGFLTPTSDILLYKYISKKGMRPSEIEEILFTMEDKLRRITGDSVPIGFEKAKLEKVIKHLMRDAMKRRNHYLIFKDLLWDADKIQRIITRLEPRYQQNSIYHMYGMGDYEEQLLRVPSGVHDDLCDTSQALCQLLKHPKQKAKQATHDDAFERVRKFAIDAKKPKRKRYIYGHKRKGHFIQAQVDINS